MTAICFVEACKQAVENGESPKRNIEAFNKFCASGEAEVRVSEANESEESEESESVENQSDESGTFITISMKALINIKPQFRIKKVFK